MMSNTEEFQYGECCCCLEKGDHRELTKQYYLNERPEVYEVLFKDTFDIVLKYPENTKLICDCCIVQLRQANHFKFMVESSQQTLSDRVNWQSEFDNAEENQLGPLNTNIFIKCDPDNQMEVADNDVKQSEPTMEEVNNDAEKRCIKDENSDVEEPSQLSVSITIKHESEDNMEGVPIADHLNIQDYSDSATSDKLAITRHKVKNIKVLLTRSPIVEQLLLYDSNRQYKHAKKSHSKQQLRTHIRKKLFYCDVCQYKTLQKTNISKHMRIHTGEKPFSCDICQYKATRKENLSSHMRTHTGEKPFSCNICQFKAAHKHNLIIHMRIHTGENPFSCGVCQYKSVRKTNIARHKLIHAKDKPFTCHICEYKSVLKGNISRHMRTHTGDKPFSCDICQYKAAQKGDISRHMRIHTGERPFSCDICEYKAKQKSNISAHMRTHTGEKPFSCDICQYKYARKQDLVIHIHKLHLKDI